MTIVGNFSFQRPNNSNFDSVMCRFRYFGTYRNSVFQEKRDKNHVPANIFWKVMHSTDPQLIVTRISTTWILGICGRDWKLQFSNIFLDKAGEKSAIFFL